MNPGESQSWPEPAGIDGYRDRLNGWWEHMPVEFQRAFYTDSQVRLVVVQCAKTGDSLEQMLWKLATVLLYRQEHFRQELVKLIERSPLPPVQLS